MTEITDHDRLVSIEGKLSTLIASQQELKVEMSKFSSRVAIQYTALEDRVRYNEKASIESKTRVDAVKENISGIQGDVDSLQKRSNILDMVLGVATAIGTLLGFLFGNKP